MEKKALEVREQVEAMLASAEGVTQLRQSGVLQEIKRLVPDVRRGDTVKGGGILIYRFDAMK